MKVDRGLMKLMGRSYAERWVAQKKCQRFLLSTRVDQRRAIQYNRKSTKEVTLQVRSLPGLLLLLQSFCHRNYFKQLERISNPVQLFCHRNYFKQLKRISKPEVLDGGSKDAQSPSFTLLLLLLNL